MSRARGADAERRAQWHYRLRGYKILGLNVWAAGYELDLIVRRGRRLVFCEVKAKQGEGFGAPEAMVTPEKQRRIRRAAEAWLARRRDLGRVDVSFEIVAVRGKRVRRLREAF